MTSTTFFLKVAWRARPNHASIGHARKLALSISPAAAQTPSTTRSSSSCSIPRRARSFCRRASRRTAHVRPALQHLGDLSDGSDDARLGRDDADADGDMHATREVVHAQRIAQPHRNLVGAAGGCIRKHEREFLAAGSRDDIARARGVQQQRTHFAQHESPARWPGCHSHLEVIDVERSNASWLPARVVRAISRARA